MERPGDFEQLEMRGPSWQPGDGPPSHAAAVESLLQGASPADAYRRLDLQPLADCPARCNGRGVCSRSGRALLRELRPEDKAPRCLCWRPSGAMQGVGGPSCTGGKPSCMNGCRGKGECVGGVCNCQPGFWGLDCSMTTGPDGLPALLRAGGPGLQPRPALRPRLYVYDLPASLSAWPLAALGFTTDFGRSDGTLLLAASLRSAHRTADPGEADYFVVPIVGGVTVDETQVDRLAALRYLRAAWPYFNASVERGAATHVFPTMCHDQGVTAYEGVMEELLRSESEGGMRLAPLPPGTPLAAALPPLLAHSVFVVCNGLNLGFLRGVYPGNRTTWWTREGGFDRDAAARTGLGSAGAFVPGKDIVVPDSGMMFNHNNGCGKPDSAPRPVRCHFPSTSSRDGRPALE